MLMKLTRALPRGLRAALLVAGAVAWAGLTPQGGLATLLAPAAHAETTAPAETKTPAPAETTAPAPAETTAPAPVETKAPAPAETKAPAAADAKLPEVPDYSEGAQDAPIHVIEYASYTCPHCAEFHADVYPELKKNYIDTGKVKFTMRAFFFDKYGLWADAIARCGGEMRYYGITDMMYDQQRDWVTAGSADKVVNKLTTIGLTAGLTKDQIQSCLSDGPMLQAMVAKFQKDSTADKIDGTPTFIINGKKYNNMSYADFSKVLDGLLKK